MSFDKSLFLVAQIMKNIVKNKLYIESYKILCALESCNIYNELVYNIFLAWNDIKEENNIHSVNIMKVNLNAPISQIVAMLQAVNRKNHPLFKNTFSLNKKHKTVTEWNEYTRRICRYYSIDDTILCKMRMKSITKKISFYEYYEICKLFLRDVLMD